MPDPRALKDVLIDTVRQYMEEGASEEEKVKAEKLLKAVKEGKITTETTKEE